MAQVKILVVEDEIIIADNICDTLEDLGYDPLEPAMDYEEAMSILDEEVPDIAILDIKISGEKDGIEVAKKIKKDFDIPFIFLTANSDRHTVEEAKEVNPAAFLVKPFTQEELFAAIEIGLNNFSKQKGNTKEKESPIIKDAFFIKTKNLYQKVLFDDILYIKSDHVYLDIWSAQKEKYIIRGSMSNIEKQLPSSFYRTHRSFIVNLDYMNAINTQYVVVENEKIPIGKTFRDNLMKRINIQ